MPAEYNPREHNEEELAGLESSIKKYGLVEVPIWNKKTGNIVGGHMRVTALRKMGRKQIEVRVVELSLEEEKKLNIALNNPASQGRFTEKLFDLLEEVKITNDFQALNFDALERMNMPDFDTPELPEIDDFDENVGGIGDSGEEARRNKKKRKKKPKVCPNCGEEF